MNHSVGTSQKAVKKKKEREIPHSHNCETKSKYPPTAQADFKMLLLLSDT